MKVSIITPCYNSEAHLQSTINSITYQTHKNIEHIIIDGNSIDNTLNIIKDNLSNNLIKYISEPDKGLYDAINKGIKLAKGDIIGILNSDDYFADEYVISDILNAFSNLKIDGLYGDLKIIKSNNKIYRNYSSNFFHPKKMKYGIMPAHPTLYLRKEVIKKIGYYNLSYKIASDFDYVVRLFNKKNYNIHYLKRNIVFMRAGGISNAGIESNKLISKEIREILKKNKIKYSYYSVWLRYFFKIKQLF